MSSSPLAIEDWNYAKWTPWTQPSVPLYLTLTLAPSFEPLRRYLGSPLFTSIIVFQDRQATWIFRESEANQLGERMLDYLGPPTRQARYQDNVSTAIEALEAELLQLSIADLSEDAVPDLLRRVHDLESVYTSFYKLAAFIEPVQIAVQKQIGLHLPRLASETGIAEKDVLAALYTSDVPSYTHDLSRSLEAIAEALIELKGPTTPLDENPELNVMARPAALDHLDRYSWSLNNYERCFEVGITDLVGELRTFGPSAGVAAEQIRLGRDQVEQTRADHLRLKQRVVSVLSPHLARVVGLHDFIGNYLLDRRKQLVMRTNGAITLLLRLIAVRLDQDLDDILFLLPEELDRYISDPELYRERIPRRKDAFLVYQADFSVLDASVSLETTDKGFQTMTGPIVAEGSLQVDEVLATLAARLDMRTTSATGREQLRGTTIYFDEDEPITVGVVKVVRDPVVDECPNGAILVATSTTPDFMGAIRRCSAIVTDWGGQTSHAALTARELKKPCIVGTNFASAVLSDGDIVQLDFATGCINPIPEDADA